MLRIYFLKELRSLFRDRNILLYGLLLPVFLYPSLLFGISQIRLYTQGLHEGAEPVVAIQQSQDLLQFLREHSDLHLRTVRGDRVAQLRNGDLDLVVTPIDDAKTYRLEYDSGRGASIVALERLRPLLRDWSRRVEEDAARAFGLDPGLLANDAVRVIDVSDPKRSTRHLLALVLPLILIVMCTFGATYPAVDLTAGERERQSVETTILLPISRTTIALGKSLAVTTAAFVALAVNLAAMLLSASPMLAGVQDGLRELPALAWRSLPVVLGFGVLLAIVFANLFLLVASYAKTYREAQAFVTPVQVVVMLPALLTVLPGSQLDELTAWIPVYNAGLIFRASLLGEIEATPVLTCLVSLSLIAWICFRATVRRLSDTAFVLGFRDTDQLQEARP